MKSLRKRDIGRQRVPRRFGQRHHPLLAALALDDQAAAVAGDAVQRQAHQLRHAQAGGVEDFQQGHQPDAVRTAPALGGREQGFDLALAQDLRQRTSLLGAVDGRRRIVGPQAFRDQEAVELAQRRQAAGDGPDRRAALVPAQIVQVSPQVIGIGVIQRDLATSQPRRDVGQIPFIGLPGIVGGSPLRHQHVEEGFDPGRCRGPGFAGTSWTGHWKSFGLNSGRLNTGRAKMAGAANQRMGTAARCHSGPVDSNPCPGASQAGGDSVSAGSGHRELPAPPSSTGPGFPRLPGRPSRQRRRSKPGLSERRVSGTLYQSRMSPKKGGCESVPRYRHCCGVDEIPCVKEHHGLF